MKQIKVRDEVYEQVQKLAEKEGTSMAAIVEKLVQLYLGGSTEEAPLKRYVEREIVNHYQRSCSKCGRELPVGQRIVMVVYEYEGAPPKRMYLCMDCYLELDPRLGRLYRKKRELEVAIRQLRKEAEQLAQVVNLRELALSAKNLLEATYRIHAQRGDDSEALRKYVEVLEKLEHITEKLRLLESTVTPKTAPPRPRRVQVQYHREYHRG